ncbi:barstar family protein [Streptomyces sp. ME19-03-3]|nr:barstar family protein [Streptomyces sp. ME19-03-3]
MDRRAPKLTTASRRRASKGRCISRTANTRTTGCGPWSGAFLGRRAAGTRPLSRIHSGRHCASGEAVNRPGGYFGWNADALDDCLIGGWGASAPFTLEWNHSDLARSRLTKPYRLAGGGSATFFEVVLEVLGRRRAEVILR